MTTVIDSLIATLELDTKNFTKGQKDAVAGLRNLEKDAKKSETALGSMNKTATEGMKKLGREVAAVGLAFYGLHALKSFAVDILNADSAVGFLSKNLGISTEELSRWQGVADKFGTSSGDVDSAFRAINNMAQTMQVGEWSGNADAMAQLLAKSGNSITIFADKTASNADRMRAIQKSLLAYGDAGQAQMWGQKSGLSEGFINSLLGAGEGLEKMLQAQKSLTSAESAQAAQDRIMAWSKLKDEFEQTGRTILVSVSPAIRKLFGEFSEFISAHSDDVNTFFHDLPGNVKAFGDELKPVIADVKNLVVAMKPLFEMAGGIAGFLGRVSETSKKTGLFWAPEGKTTASPAQQAQNERAILMARQAGEWAEKSKVNEKAKPQKTISTSLADYIGKYESGSAGYESINYRSGDKYKSATADLTNMTISQVMAKQKSGDMFAAGKYQIAPNTMPEVVKGMGLSGKELFSKEMQDSMLEWMLANKNKALSDYRSGKSSDLTAAMKGFSKIWAAAPNPETGKSYYQGVGGNVAHMSQGDLARQLINERARVAGNTNTSEVKIQSVTVNTQASDAKGVADAFSGRVKQFLNVSQANTGMS